MSWFENLYQIRGYDLQENSVFVKSSVLERLSALAHWVPLHGFLCEVTYASCGAMYSLKGGRGGSLLGHGCSRDL